MTSMVASVREALARIGADGPLATLALVLAERLDAGEAAGPISRELRQVLAQLAAPGGGDDELAALLDSGAALGD